MKQYKAAVIGLGRIGQGFDYNQYNGSVIATHASAYLHHPGYQLLAAVDPNPSQREKFELKYNRPAYSNLSSMMAHHRPEVFSIAVPVDQHFTVFQEVIQCRPKAIICEKPIAISSADGRLMQSLADDYQCALTVNYIRRFEPGSITVKHIIQEGKVGKIFKGIAWYSKGLFNNGSHFIDLLHFWLGDITHVEVMKKGRRWDNIDPEPDFCLHFNKTFVYFLAGVEEYYSIGEIKLFATGGVINYTRSGNDIKISRTQTDPAFTDYTILNPETENLPTDLKRYQWHVLEGLYKHLLDGTELNSNGHSAIKTLEVVEHICSRLNMEGL